MADNTLPIPNASWWENHSMVIIKDGFTIKDQKWINSRLIAHNVTAGQGQERMVSMQYTGEDPDELKVQRMVIRGSVVAVKRPGGRVRTVNLPDQTEELLPHDMAYIVDQIDALNAPPMTEEEQSNTSPSAGEQSAES